MTGFKKSVNTLISRISKFWVLCYVRENQS